MNADRRDPLSSAAGRDVCQLQGTPEATEALRADEKLVMALDKTARRTLRRLRKVVADPGIVVRRTLPILDPQRASEPRRARADGIPVVLRHSPPLAPGDRVRVRTMPEIEATLDDNGTCGGMGFLPIVMAKYCGGTYTVRGRVDRFFDERNWKMLKLRDSVILDDVFCQPPREAGVPWAGCDRSCFLFWKEAWLERIEPRADNGGDGHADGR